MYEHKMKPIKIVLSGGIRVSNRQDEYDQSTFYICMEISQWTPFVQLIYANKKENTKTNTYSPNDPAI
jgi:hypothetical protein